MPSNTTTSVQSNEVFSTGVVPIAVGVLNSTAWNCGVGMNYASITTIVTNDPSSLTVLLEGTFDGQTWVTLATCSSVSGETQYATGAIPFTSLRARCSAFNDGSNPTINVYVVVSQTPIQITAGGASPAETVSITSPVDGNGNVKVSQQGAVVDAQTSNRYASISNSGTTGAAPTAGAAIATLAVFDFYYEVKVTVGFGATAEVTTVDNFVLKAGATTIATIPAVNAANTQSQVYTFYVNPGGSVNLTVNVGAVNGSAGSIYKATLVATRLV